MTMMMVMARQATMTTSMAKGATGYDDDNGDDATDDDVDDDCNGATDNDVRHDGQQRQR
jgi:hypothetical protein